MILIIGWIGTTLYLIGHAYISLLTIWQKKIYYSFNLAAAVCLVFSSVYNESWQAVVINGFWTVISLLLLLKVDLTSTKFSIRQYYAILSLFVLNLMIQSLQQSSLDYAALGWISAYVFSAAYLLFSAEKMCHSHYLLWNFLAATILLPQLWIDQNWPVFGLEIVWAMISIYGVVRKYEETQLI